MHERRALNTMSSPLVPIDRNVEEASRCAVEGTDEDRREPTIPDMAPPSTSENAPPPQEQRQQKTKPQVLVEPELPSSSALAPLDGSFVEPWSPASPATSTPPFCFERHTASSPPSRGAASFTSVAGRRGGAGSPGGCPSDELTRQTKHLLAQILVYRFGERTSIRPFTRTSFKRALLTSSPLRWMCSCPSATSP